MEEAIRLFRMNRWAPALAEFLKVDNSDFSKEENAELAYYLGLCYTKLERYDDALLYLEQVVTSEPNPLRLYQCRMMLAYIYVTTGRSKLAEFELGRLVEGGFESAHLYTTLAYAAWAQRHYQKACDYYEKALELDENNATALNGLGYILADSDIDIARGLRLCHKAVDKKPKSAAYRDSLGWAYFKAGKDDDARAWLHKALEASNSKSPAHKTIREHMRTVLG
jgi:tetratricopeptide (TPR) repeat protein